VAVCATARLKPIPMANPMPSTPTVATAPTIQDALPRRSGVVVSIAFASGDGAALTALDALLARLRAPTTAER
jgi:hypothetical protein